MEIFSLFAKEMPESESDTESTRHSWIEDCQTIWHQVALHEKCVSTVKKCYGAIVSALETIYQESHEPEALGISKILSKPSTLFAIYLLDYILPEVSKLSKSLQTEKLDLSIISSLVDATLHTLEDLLQPAAKWVLDKEEMDITVCNNSNSDVASFQSQVTEQF